MSLVDAIAVALAVVDAACFALAALLQHRAVRRATLAPGSGLVSERLTAARFTGVFRQPIWLLGCALMAGGTILHIIALALAPVSTVQPVGVLAVPFAVLFALREAPRRPNIGMVAGVTLSVGGTIAFVLLADSPATPVTMTLRELLTTAGVLAAVVTLLWLVSARAGRTFRCTGLASAGAICFGFGTTLLRSLAQPASTDLHTLLTPVAITSGVIMIMAMIVGGWAIQQAYNHGRAELVISTLTVGDPLVAVLLGIGLLGEGAGLGLWTAAFMIVCALIAATGVALLAKYHPEMAVDHDKTPSTAPALSRTP